jgi:hypothetical protein
MEGWALLLVLDCLGWPWGFAWATFARHGRPQCACALRPWPSRGTSQSGPWNRTPHCLSFGPSAASDTHCSTGQHPPKTTKRRGCASLSMSSIPRRPLAAGEQTPTGFPGKSGGQSGGVSGGATMALSARQRRGVAHGASTEGAKSHTTRYIGRRHDKNRAANSDWSYACLVVLQCFFLRREPLHERYHASAICKAGQKNCLRAVCLLAPRFLSRARSPSTVGCLLECVLWPLH